jgi:acetolactate synthase-1/2/3 large subunit
MKATELFVKCLEAEGVEYIFGVPGEENAHFMMALEDSPIRFVLTRHEQGAAFMADAIGRLTGKAAVCLGTLGPGATNLVTGVADANMDHAPVVVITGQADVRRQHKESHQAMDVVGLFKPVTKWAHSIIHPDNIPEVVRKAFKLAEEEKPGACHIELPEDIAQMKASTRPIEPERVRRPVPDDKIVDRAMALLREAKRPLILAGNGAIRKRASKQLRLFVEATGIGVVTTFMGKGAVPYDWLQSLYTIGLQSKDVVACAVDAADVVIALGYDLVEYHPRFWNDGNTHKIIDIDFQPAEVDENYRVDVEIVGDLAHTLWMMNERVAAEPLRFDVRQHHAAREEMTAELAKYNDDDTDGLIRPQKVLWDTREVMDPDDILLSDVGAHKMWIARHYHCTVPNTCLIPNGFCSMGFALPGAIGAKLVNPDRRVLAVCGDAGFMMNVQEMETAKRLGTNVVAMVWEDKSYGLIEWKQKNEFGKHVDLSFDNPDFMKLADSFGWRGFRAENARDLRDTLEVAFDCGQPALVVVPIDYSENVKLTKRLGNIVCPI